MNRRFDHETLAVYQAGLAFIPWQESILRGGEAITITITITSRQQKGAPEPNSSCLLH